MVTAPQHRQGVIFLNEREISERRACSLVGLSRSSFHYAAHPLDNTELEERLKKTAQKYPRYGYRRAWALERRSGRVVNHKRVYRMWQKLGLSLPRRRRKKRGNGQGMMPVKAEYPNQVWSYDFLFDACENGKKLKILTVADEFTREGLAVEVDSRLPSRRVLEVLDKLFRERGAPEHLRSDNGPEFIARIVKRRLTERGTKTIYIDPGCPWQNAYVESFNGRLRDECLNLELFHSVNEGKVVMENWRSYYNEERPHSSLGYQTPAEYRAAWLGKEKRQGLEKLMLAA